MSVVRAKPHGCAEGGVAHAVFAGAVLPLCWAVVRVAGAGMGLNLAVLDQSGGRVSKALVATPYGSVGSTVFVLPAGTITDFSRASNTAQLAFGGAVNPCMALPCGQRFAAGEAQAGSQDDGSADKRFQKMEVAHVGNDVDRVKRVHPWQPGG